MSTMSEVNHSSGRGNNWSDVGVSLLLAAWREESIQKMIDGTSRDSVVYRTIADRAAAKGLKRSPEQCHQKIKNMKAKFRQNDLEDGEVV